MEEKQKAETGLRDHLLDRTLVVPDGAREAPTAAPGAKEQDFKGRLIVCSRHVGIHLFEEFLCVSPRLAFPGAGSGTADQEYQQQALDAGKAAPGNLTDSPVSAPCPSCGNPGGAHECAEILRDLTLPKAHRLMASGDCSCGWKAGAMLSHDQAVTAWKTHSVVPDAGKSEGNSRESEGKMAIPQAECWPAIPTWMQNPLVFRDAFLGIVLVSDVAGGQMIYRIHEGHWCTVRMVSAIDGFRMVDALNLPKPAPLPHLADSLSQVTSEGEARAHTPGTSPIALAHSAYLRGPVARLKDGCSLCGKPDCWYARHPLCEILDVLTRLGMLGHEPVWREEWRLRADAPAADQVSSAVPSEEAAALGCRDSAVHPPRSGAVPGDTPLVHSTLLEMIGFAATGRCMACGWKLKPTAIAVEDAGCVQGNCSFRPGEHNPEYPRWWQRTQILALARKYLKGELGKDAAAEAGR